MVRKAAIHIVGPVRLYQRGRYWHAAYTMEGKRVRQSLKVSNLKVAERKAREDAESPQGQMEAEEKARKSVEQALFGQ